MKKIIDISAWQEDVDWQQVKNEVDGVILKLGEGSHMDDMFVSHVNNAVAVGLPYGVYYYAHAENVADAVTEAKWVNDTINTWLAGRTPKLGIWYDTEDNSMLTDTDDITNIVNCFVNVLANAGHRYVGVYASWNWLSEEGAGYIDINSLIPSNMPIWVANYGDNVSFYGSHRNYLKEEYPNKNIKIHQFTDSGTVANISPVDCNIYYD